ncbi:MAG: MFS transporter [Verrucomicrobiales bacterium]|nr:MFS transporter [Verrucomicrobiales bacterium]
MSSRNRPAVDVQRDDRFPPGIPFIVGNEGAERFSYYGMRQILYVYLTSLFIGFAAESAVSSADLASAKVRATQITHLFMAGVYLFPMIGAILADRWLGKYRVILFVSFIYCAGHAALAIAGRAGVLGNLGVAEGAMLAGLTLIALGSGGIKPCVSANVGDQFSAKNGHLITRVFQIFYFIINFGSFFASLMTPYLYKNYGPEIAFGVPGILMALATVVFWMGRNRFVRVPPKPGGRLGALDFVASSLMMTPILVLVAVGAGVAEEVVDAAMKGGLSATVGAAVHIAATYWPHALGAVLACGAGFALFRKRQGMQEDSGFLSVLMFSLRHRAERKAGEDFWGPARRHFGDEAAEGPPAVLRIIVVFSMVSVFWALFDQHASTWVEQAKAMNLTLSVPKAVWSGWLIPATVCGAAFGAVWLFAWVSNRALPRSVTLGVVALMALWGVGAVAAHFISPETARVDLLPAQISALNPLFVMLVIPLLNLLVYQPLERRGRPLRPLQRMGIGMCLTSLSFVAVALLQMRIQVQGPGTVHVLWQVIPYFVVTTAEVLVSVTGLEFAYTQAPRAMKSTIAGFWLLCVTFGNVLVAFLAPLQKLSLSTFFWLFAVLMALAAVAFLFLASRYRGKSYLQPSA